MRRVSSAFFGIAARRALFDYVFITGLMIFVLLAIAWTIDLAETYPQIQRVAQERNVSVLSLLAPYMGYRAVDIILRLLPVSCFFGIFIAEVYRRFRLDTVVLSAAGASSWRLLGPIVVFGLLFGALSQQLESRWRPAVLFKGMQSDALEAVYQVDRMAPSDAAGGWHLSGVTVWNESAKVGRIVEDLTLSLDLTQEEIVHFGIPGLYLRTAPLRALYENAYPGSRVQIWADVAVWRRNTIFFMPFVIAALALSLARLGYVGRMMHIPRLIALGSFGYISVITLKVFFSMGEIGGVSGMAANLAPILYMGCVALFLTLRAT